ncbi:MAG: molybdopterin oxidoreductase family protein [Thiolinea sp.]
MFTVPVACPHDCPDTCAMRVTVNEAGRAIKIEGDPQHPTTDGVLCTKVARYLERTYHPDRLLYPLKRIGRKGEGKFERISWDEALSTIAERLKPIAARHPEAIMPYSYGGTMGMVQKEGMAARFFNKLGASRLDRTICASAGAAAMRATYGAGVGMDVEQLDQAKLILIWGSNPITTGVHIWRKVQEAQRKGAMVIAIDPHRSLTAQKCQQHIAVLPGTDAALAFGLMHIFIREQWLDHDYIERYTLGFNELAERASQYTPEHAATICGISAAEIEALAALIAKTALAEKQPVAFRLGYGAQRVRGGANAIRAVGCLPSLIGAWRHAAGGLLLSSSGFYPMNAAELERPDLYPNGLPRLLNMSIVGDHLLHAGDERFGPKVEAVIVYNSNPVAIAPESAKVEQGFAREDLFTVVLEHFQTDTVDYADIVLPATTQLEHSDIHKSYGHRYILLSQQAIQPLGECKSNSEIFRLLAAQMGFTDSCFQDDDLTLAKAAFNWQHPYAATIQWETLQQQGWQKLNIADAAFAEGNFPTPTGRCEFSSTELAEQGMDPLPDYLPPYESVASNPDLAARYPLQLISPPARHFLNSSFVNVDSLRKQLPEPTVEIHPADAAARNLQAGQLLTVFNERGEFQVKAVITDRVKQGVVLAYSIWWKKLSSDGKNCNEVASQALTDLGAAATFYDCLVEVKAA